MEVFNPRCANVLPTHTLDLHGDHWKGDKSRTYVVGYHIAWKWWSCLLPSMAFREVRRRWRALRSIWLRVLPFSRAFGFSGRAESPESSLGLLSFETWTTPREQE